MIPDEAVEAAARVLWAKDCGEIGWGCPSWDESADQQVWASIRVETQEAARELLEAAAPHLLAPVIELAGEFAADATSGDSFQDGRGSGFRIAGARIRQVLGIKH